MNIRQLLSDKFQAAMISAGIPEDCGPVVAPAKKAGFGDYQANGAMAAAKRMGTNPRELAGKILEHLDKGEMIEKVEIAGPGFLNIHLSQAWLAEQLAAAEKDPRLNIAPAAEPQTVVIDYSHPNLAKEMHVGHLRSTIIGDALARLLEFQGHKVIRQNHMGDWGTQFGMLLAHLSDKLENSDAEVALADLEAFYREAKVRFDDEEGFADRAREYVVKLQGGDPECLKLWQQFIDISISHSEEIYEKLNVTLKRSDVYGESQYNDDLPVLVKELLDRGIAVEDQGAIVVFLEEMADKEGNPSPMIIQKKGGGYLYATTDLAAIRYRANKLQADRILYVVDARQSLHLQQAFTASRKAAFLPENVTLEHCAFGTMMGDDGKPFKTRTGGTVKLAALLDEAVERASNLVAEKNPDLDPATRAEIARKVGIGAVKYADLSKTRTNDYVFSWEAMLSFEGNTAPYLQYAYTRVRSIFRRAGVEPSELKGEIHLETAEERTLAIKLCQFGEVLDQVAKDTFPHVLCTYLYDLASAYMAFYEACPVLKEGVSEAQKQSRLQLCNLVARTIATGLDLLGIEVMEQM
ncbi:arginine--tRNA ligase [Microbulbifer thermotolerans]|uniref:Arginine--tRNA ligase n=1 Tax=Microbulbifer thermotolerans TaxID=252514 RepID=A0A143HNV6_MICTH|nr:arginine--tRNA ligase [Microbulbifer thermotolerans]AMX03120.1 arginine--tRNA ligase [Microbulbifer thermotolerans]MCX2781154.1 arginine--tRNA ligase [Microbulbifer thermotolerans]MCX2784444.1 arginine--tRNA ligase [Microbulbifer thermotolerans]MCX2796033.1 arginine--tRNA ligase [Microbulbifer thermotolerans]MCX2803169.1 arginine--tRNA ligase [Microbulbifer thermotolerans]